jgi:hypothetical protein
VWIWFKCDWWKWVTLWKLGWIKNLNIPWNQNWLKWWKWNASHSIRVKCEFDSNVIGESDLQNEKRFNPPISTLLGIKIDWSDDRENASDLIRVKCEFDSNMIDESELHCGKNFDPTISTLFGIKIDWSDEDENVSDSIRLKREFDSDILDLSGPGALNLVVCAPWPGLSTVHSESTSLKCRVVPRWSVPMTMRTPHVAKIPQASHMYRGSHSTLNPSRFWQQFPLLIGRDIKASIDNDWPSDRH